MAAWYTRRRETRGRAREREEGSQAQAGRVIIILQTTAAGTYLYNPSPSFAFEPSSRSSLPPLVLPSFHPPRLSRCLHPPRGDSRTRYLSSPRAIRTNGRIRQLSRYIPPTLRASSSLSIASPPPRRRFLLILVLLPLPLPLSRPLSRPRLCSPCIRSRRKCTPASATRSGFSFHAQWQSPFDADFRLTRFIRSPHYTPFPAPLFLPRPHRRYWRTSRTLEKNNYL